MPDDAHSLLPELYDLDVDATNDIAFYEDFARAGSGPLLELGVGTGRVAIPLAQAGFDVWGIDSSKAMLNRARSKASEAHIECLHLDHGDMRDFDLGRTFALIYAGFGSFHHLLSPDEQLACLRCVATHLAPDGVFICDLRPWFHDTWDPGDSSPVLHDWTRTLPSTGDTVTKTRTAQSNAALQTRRQTNFYDLLDANGDVRRMVAEVDLRFTTRYEMEGLLHTAGLQMEQLYGDYDLAAFDEHSEYMITMARKPEDPS